MALDPEELVEIPEPTPDAPVDEAVPDDEEEATAEPPADEEPFPQPEPA